MKKTLALLLALTMVFALAACGGDAETPDTTPTPSEDVSTPDVATPDESTPDVVTPDETTPDEATPDETTPDDSAPPATADVVELTVTGIQENWYLFDLAAFQMVGEVYALYFDDGATVTFPNDVELVSVDATTFAATNTPYPAGTTLNVADINGQSIAIGATGNSVCFVLASAPGNYTGMVADKPLSELPASVVLTVA